MAKTMMPLRETDRGKKNWRSNRGSRQGKSEMIEYIYPTKAMASSNECPCVTILHITQKLIKNNKIASGGKLADRDEVHGELGNVGNIGDVKVGSVQGATASNGQSRAINNDNTQVCGNRLTRMQRGGIKGHMK